jgi:hypothetical protein
MRPGFSPAFFMAMPNYLRALAATNFGVKLARIAATSLRVVDTCT